MNYIFNPLYVLRHEGNKSLIISKQGYGAPATLNVIHPAYAKMLSFFDGSELQNIYSRISLHFGVSKDIVERHLTPLLNNPEFIHNGDSVFPPHLLIPIDQNISEVVVKHNPREFDYDPNNIDLCISRLKSPIDIICNLTMQCVTSCVYCYADRKGHQSKKMSIELLRKILKEASDIGVVRFKLMGGEVLLYPEWDEVVRLSVQYGYQPDISIKKPLSEEEVIKWKELKATTDPIQISLDTLILDHMCRSLNVRPEYRDRIIKTFHYLDKYKIPYVVHSVISSYNDTIDDIKSVYSFLKERKFIKGWMMDAAKCSMYNGLPYSDYRTSCKNVELIQHFVNELNESHAFPFEVQPPRPLRDYNKLSPKEKKVIFDHRRMCSGNLNALYILPDGKVTICEELYWHPHFIIGDLNSQSLQEIWDSDTAKNLFYLHQEDIPSDSPCSNCKDFTSCRKYKHVCWRDTILAYGHDKWYYPDISCPNAPTIPNDISMK